MSGLSPTRAARHMRAYDPPRARWPIDLWLDANEGPTVSPAALGALERVDVDALRRYPDARSLEAELAGVWGVNPERVIVGAGGDDIIERACRAMIEPGRCGVMTTPTFSMIRRAVLGFGGEATEIRWIEGAFPMEEFIRAIRHGEDSTAAPASIAFIVSPNNPTGGVASARAICEVARRSPETLVVADLAYAEFADVDPMREILHEPNVLCVRTMSKAMGLAGLRVGYGLGSVEVVGWLRAVSLPFAVSGAAIAAARAVVREPDPNRDAMLRRIRWERARLAEALASGGAIVPVPDGGQGNFVFARWESASRAAAFCDELERQGIAIRRFGGELADAIRITCPGLESQYQRLETAIALAITAARQSKEPSP